jgi:hypothetical protein
MGEGDRAGQPDRRTAQHGEGHPARRRRSDQVGEETIGAVGVSGSSTEPDEVCAMAAIAGVADQLK